MVSWSGWSFAAMKRNATNRRWLVPVCGLKIPQWRSRTPAGSAAPPGGRKPNPNRGSSYSSRSGPDHPPPPLRNAPSVSAAATGQDRGRHQEAGQAVGGAKVHYAVASDGGCESTVSILPRMSNGVKSDRLLDRLAGAGLLFVRGKPPEATYLFKHALVQDAAYGTLLRARRQQIHPRVAETLEERFPEIVRPDPRTGSALRGQPA